MNANKKLAKAVLGTFTGKCCDSNVFNNNDMHLSRKLFENLLSSEEYQRALKLGHYIGFLSHPEDPDCQDDKNACIVMRDLRILDNGELEGNFDLINTPVGQIVKTFIDAGVKYGISIRGLGDVGPDGEVDPDEFIFRGFDLVRFPAYDDCIPEFQAIAASTDAKKKAQFKKICASVKSNLSSITSSSALNFIKDELPEGSDIYNDVQTRLDELSILDETTCEDDNCELSVCEAKLKAVTDLYIDAAARIRELEQQLVDSQNDVEMITLECKKATNKLSHLKRVTCGQLESANESIEELDEENRVLASKVHKYERNYSRISADLRNKEEDLNKVQASIDKVRETNKKLITANSDLRKQLSEVEAKIDNNMSTIEASNNLNLKYQQRIKANSETISQKDSEIEELKEQLHETVVANKKLESKASNLDDKNGHLLSRVEAAEEMVYSYQQAYANMYANALGVYLQNLPITATTSVNELKAMITAGTSTANIAASPSVYSETDLEDEYEEQEEFIEESSDLDETRYNAQMVTL